MLFFPPVVDAFNISHVRTLKERFLREKKKKKGKTQYFLGHINLFSILSFSKRKGKVTYVSLFHFVVRFIFFDIIIKKPPKFYGFRTSKNLISQKKKWFTYYI